MQSIPVVAESWPIYNVSEQLSSLDEATNAFVFQISRAVELLLGVSGVGWKIEDSLIHRSQLDLCV